MDEYRLACDIAELYEEVDPVERDLEFDVDGLILRSITGNAEYPFELFAEELLTWIAEKLPERRREADELRHKVAEARSGGCA